MRLVSILNILLLCLSYISTAQVSRFKLYGERNKDKIQLAWIPEEWTDNMKGVIIKRKVNQSDWQTLSQNMIVPASYIDKDLSNVEPFSSEQERLKNKLKTLIDNQKAKPISDKEYIEEILPDKTKHASIAFIFAIDYDLMLLNGFGFIDREINENTQYEYGLFPANGSEIANEPVATLSMLKDGRDVNIPMESLAEVVGNNKKLRLHWIFDLQEYREKEIKGFNIYQVIGEDQTRLNENVIWITSKNDPADLNYIINFPDQESTFKAVPVSYFGTEGMPNEIHFKPASYLIKIPAPDLSCSSSSTNSKLSWTISHQYDSLVSQYIVEEYSNGKFNVLEKTSAILREYVINDDRSTISKYRVTAQTVTGKDIWSNECVVSRNKKEIIAAPANLKGEIVQKDGKYFIELSWSYDDTEDHEFRIYTDGPGNNLIYDSSLPGEVSSPYLIEIIKSRSEKRKFAVLARNSDRKNSDLSNQVEVLTPSLRLPPVSINSISNEEDGIKIDWRFSDSILDLDGFIILIDNEPVLTENEVNRDLRSFRLDNISKGRHEVKIIAVTSFNVESDPSISKTITIK